MALTSREEVDAHGFTSAGPWLGRLIAFRPLVGVAVPGSIRWRKLNSSWPGSMKERALVSQSWGTMLIAQALPTYYPLLEIHRMECLEPMSLAHGPVQSHLTSKLQQSMN